MSHRMNRREVLRVSAALLATFPLAIARGESHEPHDPYGGWTTLQGKKTGFFHTEEIQGRWWFVDPDGNAFFSKGVNSVSLAGAEDEPATKAADGSPEKWAEDTAKRLRSWGLNTAGCWSEGNAAGSPRGVGGRGIAWTPRPHLTEAHHDRLPDVFDPKWSAAVHKRAAEQCGPLKDDPWVLGYFTDNELPWHHEDEAAKVLQMFLDLPPGSPGRQKAEAFVQKHGHADAHGHKAAEFRAEAARAYFKVTAEAIRAADPNHLILGCRFAGRPPMDVVREMKGHADVISINNYSAKPPADLLREMHKETGLPVVVTEFSVKARDAGPLTSHGSGPVVATQQDRARHYANYVGELADLHFCVGYHWFRYRDHPGNNQGLVKTNEQPWEELAAAFRETNAKLDERHGR